MAVLLIILVAIVTFSIVGFGVAGWTHIIFCRILGFKISEPTLEKIAQLAWFTWILFFVYVIYTVINGHPFYSSFIDYLSDQVKVFVIGIIGTVYYSKNFS